MTRWQRVTAVLQGAITMGMAIRSLSSEVVDQIAAGEVVERPAHMVKELVENSLDAGASMVEVEFEQGGRRVRVTDDGGGIDESELSLALARHATSKISTAADLWKLTSFGFRGEALASISAVSRLTLTSRQEGCSSAGRVKSEFGRVSKVEQAGGNQGTTVLIEELFANVPARLKFLKSETAEGAQIKNTLKALALTHPNTEFRLKSAGKTLQVWPKSKGFRERVEQVLDVRPMFESRAEFGGMRVHAVFASPHQVAGNARQIWLFVQDRWVQDRGLQAAVLDAYRGLLMHGEYPIAVIKVEVPTDEVDVNIHPTKSAVKFRDTQLAFRAVHRCLRTGLEQAPWLERASSASPSGRADSAVHSSVRAPNAGYQSSSNSSSNSDRGTASVSVGDSCSSGLSEPQPLSFQEPELARTQYQKRAPYAEAAAGRPPVTFDVLRAAATAAPAYMGSTSEAVTETSATENTANVDFVRSPSSTVLSETRQAASFWSRLQVLGQAHLTYILAEDDRTLYLVDQHAAHERVAYERLMRAWRQGEVERQELLLPLTLDLDAEVVEALVTQAPELARIGIEAEAMGPDAVAVRAIPAGIRESVIASSLAELGREIVEKGGGFAIERKIGDLCATMACHSVVRAGQALSHEQMTSLLAQMDEFPLSSFCPHGRPVSVEYPFHKLERDFGRIT